MVEAWVVALKSFAFATADVVAEVVVAEDVIVDVIVVIHEDVIVVPEAVMVLVTTLTC